MEIAIMYTYLNKSLNLPKILGCSESDKRRGGKKN
jgi:hypothetical protein